MTNLQVNKDEIEYKLKIKDPSWELTAHEGKSDAWSRFKNILFDKQAVNGFVACGFCCKVYIWKAQDGTQTLRLHKCPTKTQVVTPKIKDAFLKSSESCISPKDKEALNETVVLMAATDLRPLSFTSGTGFQNLAQKLIELGAKYGKNTDVKTVFLDPSRYSRRLLSNMYHKAVDCIKEELDKQLKTTPKHLPAICFTVD